jgi:hypothetical protein
MIEHVLKFYGINCNNKWIGYFATGISLSFFAALISLLLFVKSYDDIKCEIFFKIFFSISITSKLFNYLMIKYKSIHIFELNHKLEKFQNKCRISQLNIQVFSYLSVFFAGLLAFITTKTYFCKTYSTELFEDLNEKMDSIPIPSLLQMFLMNFYHYLMQISFQLLYIEFKTRYISIIKEFKINVMNEKFEPDIDVLKLTQKFVLKFVNFKTDIKTNVDFLKYGISLEFISNIVMLLFSHENSGCLHFEIPLIVLIIVYYLWTMSLNFRIRLIENNLSFILNQWLHLKPEIRL